MPYNKTGLQLSVFSEQCQVTENSRRRPLCSGTTGERTGGEDVGRWHAWQHFSLVKRRGWEWDEAQGEGVPARRGTAGKVAELRSPPASAGLPAAHPARHGTARPAPGRRGWHRKAWGGGGAANKIIRIINKKKKGKKKKKRSASPPKGPEIAPGGRAKPPYYSPGVGARGRCRTSGGAPARGRALGPALGPGAAAARLAGCPALPPRRSRGRGRKSERRRRQFPLSPALARRAHAHLCPQPWTIFVRTAREPEKERERIWGGKERRVPSRSASRAGSGAGGGR